ncbi:MAG TPA: DoxX family protein [Polyangiaceae bacterium]|nr:DoxX family protein [Polyangiaceae bacterium]
MTTKLKYWIPTGLLAAMIFISGVANVTHQPRPMQAALHLGYPPYIATELGIWKLLAAVTFVFGARWPRLKEWAFAGVFFDLSGALVAHTASGDGLVDSAPAGVLLLLTGVAYVAHRRFTPEPLATMAPPILTAEGHG